MRNPIQTPDRHGLRPDVIRPLTPGQLMDQAVERAYRAARVLVVWLVLLTVLVVVLAVDRWT
jgi:hypothetical protein